MGAKEVIKKKVLEAFGETDISFARVVLIIGIACICAFYIYAIYKILTRKTFYNKNFNMAIALLTVITAGIILTIQSSIIVSLGMVGALSIVRFRTAVKDPMDLIFLFWAIATGIICGAGLFTIAATLLLVITVMICVLDKLPMVKESKLFIINSTDVGIDIAVENVIRKYCKYYLLKSENMTNGQVDLIYEVRTDRHAECIKEIWNLEGVISATCMNQEGETTF